MLFENGNKPNGMSDILIIRLESQHDWNVASPGKGHDPIDTSKDASEQLSVGSYKNQPVSGKESLSVDLGSPQKIPSHPIISQYPFRFHLTVNGVEPS